MIKEISVREKSYLFVIMVVAAILIFMRLYEDDFWLDGLLYVEVARNIVESGDWLSLQCYWGPFLDHPPLALWLIAAGFKLFGINAFAARFFISLIGLSFFVIFFYFLKRMFSSRIAVLASLVMCFNMNFMRHASKPMMDVPMVLFITIGLFSVIFALKYDSKYFLLFGVAGALSFLTKGVISGLLLVPVLAYLVIYRPGSLVNRYFLMGIALYIMLPFLWLIPQHLFADKSFLGVYINRQISGNTMPRVVESKGYFKYIIKLIAGDFPILFFGIVGIAGCVKKKMKEFGLLYIYMLVVALVYSFVKLDVDRYYLYLYPPLALLSAFPLDRLLKGERLNSALKVVLLIFVALTIIMPIVPVRYRKLRSQEFIIFKELMESRIEGEAKILSYKNCYHPSFVKRKAGYYLGLDVDMVSKESVLYDEMNRNDISRIAVMNKEDYLALKGDFKNKFNPVIESNGKLFIPNGKIRNRYVRLDAYPYVNK